MTRKNKNNKLDKNTKKYVDPYELQDGENVSYLKELAGLTALIGG